ncbi:MAG: lipid biosynthesis acyltransferase [Chlorobi bacterium]|nr:lipid biosynthesis acyltransferase [Chlorobiota bacterium]
MITGWRIIPSSTRTGITNCRNVSHARHGHGRPSSLFHRYALLERLNAALWRFLFGPLGRIIPFGLCRVAARPLAAIARGLGARRSIVQRNLKLAFPELGSDGITRIERATFVNLITVFLELITLRHLSDAALRRRLRVHNIELLRGIGGEGALLLSGHFGNWELLALGAAAISGVPFSVVVTQQRDYGQIDRMRTSRGNRLIPTGRAARESTAILRDGGVVAMLADQSASERDPIVQLFGIPTHTFSAPARLALRFRPRIIAGFAARAADGNYDVDLMEIEHADLPDTEDGARALMQRYVEQLEIAIRRHPEQWVWQHRRWKHSPGVRYDD